ncbi:TetR/AcrR family transcriptional regulator C-terminal domain-containing protein [Streptomyces sp. NPDC055287]
MITTPVPGSPAQTRYQGAPGGARIARGRQTLGRSFSAPLDNPQWRDGLAEYTRGYRRVYLRHPNVTALVARRRVEADKALRGYDALPATLVRAGCCPDRAAEAAAAFDDRGFEPGLRLILDGLAAQLAAP